MSCYIITECMKDLITKAKAKRIEERNRGKMLDFFQPEKNVQ